MNSFQESKNELEAAIRYAENAISAAQTTIESMQFRQDMAKKEYEERTGREKALDDENIRLQKVVIDLETLVEELRDDKVRLNRKVESLEAEVANLKECLKIETAALDRLREDTPTMPVIPKAVAIAIFREGVAHGVSKACDELDNSADIEINESEYCGDFEVSFSKCIDLSDHLDFDWLRSEVGVNDEEDVIEALKNLCADNKFECRIHGVDDNED